MKTHTRRRDLAAASVLYAAATLAFTWPLARGLTRDVPGDYGDPLLNIWILAWDATHFGRGWWNANIFHPHSLALAYSEHLAAQATQVLPVYWLTQNPILCYNLLFLSTFVLSGIGAFLLARELTGHVGAAIVAGLAFAFAPYRVASLPHLQVLSSAWMPFTLYGFRCYFDRRRPAALAGAAFAWVMQNLSCGYYLLYFTPVVVLYILWELTTRRMWKDKAALISVAAACAAVAAVTLPFLIPYLELRQLGFSPRSARETRRFSADAYGYFTADPNVHLWGATLRAWPKAEGALFPGLTIAAIAAYAVVQSLLDRFRTREARAVASVFCIAAGLIVVLVLGYSIRLPGLKITSLPRVLLVLAVLFAVVLSWSRDARRSLLDWLSSPTGYFAFITAFAIAMSFGPDIRARDRVVLGTNLYAFFYRFVPGFDGLRVPARFDMIATLGLAVLAALGLARFRRPSLSLLVGTLVLVESFAAPIPIDQSSSDYQRSGLAPLPDLQRSAPPVYTFVASLPAGGAIAELPLGEPAFDVRYMYYSTRHWRRLVNGYTGGLPPDYESLDQALQDLFTRPDRAWTALRQSRAEYVIVHESFYAGNRGPQVSNWLRQEGAHEIASFDADRVFEMP